MKLYVTMTSPYARMARIAILEHGLSERVMIEVARTRETGSSYYDIVPSGRVPVLALDDSRLLEESDIICAYFDQIGAGPPLSRPMEQDNWDYGRLHALARSFVDGIAVWGRETKRSPADQSQTIIAHEQARCQRLLAVWESEIAHPIMQGELCLAQLMLLCGIDSLRRYIGQDLTDGKPALRGWKQRLDQHPSIAQTLAVN